MITCVNIKQETISDEPEEAEFASVIDEKVAADFQTELEYSGENNEYFEEKREFNEVINPIEIVELSSTADFESNINTLDDVNDRTSHQTEKSQSISLDGVKIESNEGSELAECEPTIKPCLLCSRCGQAFSRISPAQLKEHYKNHLGANPYDAIDTTKDDRTEREVYAQNQVKNTECPIEESGNCEGKAPVRQSILNKRIKKYKCPIEGCDELLSSNNRSFHLASKHKTTQLECDICKKTFVGLSQIRRHMSVHGAKCTRYTCKLCGKSNLTKETLQRYHYKQKFECPLCKERFCQKTALKMHHIDEHGGKDPVEQSKLRQRIKRPCPIEGCNELVSSNNRRSHIAYKHPTNNEPKNITQFECDICGKKLRRKQAIRNHILRYHVPSSKKYKCDLCGSAFLSGSSLKQHHKRVHVKEQNCMCNECGETFILKSSLIMHMTKHTGEKPYPCTFEGCSKRFRLLSTRLEHLRSHTGEKPFHCEVEGCDRRFSYAVDIKRHKFTAHGIYSRKYPCQICSEIFPENMLLKKHMKKHENQI